LIAGKHDLLKLLRNGTQGVKPCGFF